MFDLQRLKNAIKYLKKNDFIEKQQDLATKLGYNKTYISGILNGKIELSSKFVEAFCMCFPFIDCDWLMHGEGKMLVQNEKKNDDMEKNYSILINLLNEKEEKLKEKDAEIEKLKSENEKLKISARKKPVDLVGLELETENKKAEIA